MAEVVGLVASVITVAGTGLALSRALRETVSEFRASASHVQDLATSITNFSHALRQIGNCIKEKNSPHSEEALVTIRQVVEHCKAIFANLDRKINAFKQDKNKDGGMSSRNKLKWYFKKSNVRYLISRLDSEKSTLRLLLQVLQLRYAMNDSRRANETDSNLSEQVAELRDLVQELVLDRVWARQKEEASIHNKAKDAEKLALRASSVQARLKSASPDALKRESHSSMDSSDDDGQESADNEHDSEDDEEPDETERSTLSVSEDVSATDNNALVIYSATLQKLDKALPIHEPVIPSTVITRSTKAIDFLLDKWTNPPAIVHDKAMPSEDDISDAIDFAQRLGLSQSPPKNRYEHLLPSNKSFPSFVPLSLGVVHDEIQASTYITPWVLAKNENNVPALCDGLKPGEKFTLDTLGSLYLAKSWDSRQNAYTYCWNVSDGQHIMYFMGMYYVATKRSKRPYSDFRTTLPSAWFAKNAIKDTLAINAGDVKTVNKDSMLNFEDSPFGRVTKLVEFAVDSILSTVKWLVHN